jgi:hypothetical protein
MNLDMLEIFSRQICQGEVWLTCQQKSMPKGLLVAEVLPLKSIGMVHHLSIRFTIHKTD